MTTPEYVVIASESCAVHTFQVVCENPHKHLYFKFVMTASCTKCLLKCYLAYNSELYWTTNIAKNILLTENHLKIFPLCITFSENAYFMFPIVNFKCLQFN